MSGFPKLLTGALITALFVSCTGKHLLNNNEYSDHTGKSFEERKKLAENRKEVLFDVFKRDLSNEQSDALKFLFAYMPLSDLADYSGEFFLANAEMALRAKDRVPWGKEIPEDIFLHYVLPCRVNNENLDSFRIAYFDEIHGRINGMEIHEAALEINYWCQEKVTYQPSDIRTSSPMCTILSARGRCGEESTFTVAALRTAGIPARQVYTPRWAHTDDNHAWVEVWIDGEWFYMGACEPEPVFNRGWFTEPARRSMLVHTKSFGAPYGNENSIIIHRNYTEVNNLSKYAATKRIFVKVLDMDDKPVENAAVEYRLYNYAEFYPLATVPTDNEGISSFETGFGDLLVWARKGELFDWEKISVNNTDTLILQPGREKEKNYSVNLDLAVPPVPAPFPGPSAELLEANASRVDNGNRIREDYINTWNTNPDSVNPANYSSIDRERINKIILRSMGNYRETGRFIRSVPDSLINVALQLLEVLPDKDLRDTKSTILSDHLLNSVKFVHSGDTARNAMFTEYVLNPRIATEMLVAWRGYFRINIPGRSTAQAAADPEYLVNYLNENIRIANEENYYNTPITPIGVYELKVSDEQSRAVCFVAMCRSLGIPARLESAGNIPQYWQNNKWNDVFFDGQHPLNPEKGYIRLRSSQTRPVPEYYTHFTLARFSDGRYNTLEYEFNRKITEFKELELPAGSYMLVTGNRISDSRILANLTFFELGVNEHRTVDVELPAGLGL